MRPEILYPLFTPVTSLKGVGPKLAPVLQKHVGTYVRDLLFWLPTQVIMRPIRSVKALKESEIQTLDVEIDTYAMPSPKGPLRIEVSDDTGSVQLVFFRPMPNMSRQHPIGARRIISGRVERFGASLQISHPDYMVPPERISDIPDCEPVYPATAELSSRQIRKLINKGLETLQPLPEWLSADILEKQGWASFEKALKALHAPRDTSDLSPATNARTRLAYDEALSHQISIKSRKQYRKKAKAKSFYESQLADNFIAATGFKLTNAQARVIAEVRADLASGHRMNRLVQGDVGAGKTVIALMAMLDVAQSGGQSVLMAPTEILAHQHYEKAIALLEPLGIAPVLMTGKDKGSAREAKRALTASGEAKLIFGTHALFQEGVDFAALHLAIVDEQHRFGVEQRQRLFEKGQSVHYLSMSATPIPRTLALTQYGEAELSLLDEKPSGRQPIHTAVVPRARMEDIYSRLRSAIAAGSQAYWICPLVEDSAESDLIAAEVRYTELKSILGDRVGLVHGRMAADQKNEIISQFAKGEISVLCATTVIEVGIDVPNASIIIIEQAERFGLAQLHQLRGRVGRGSQKSACILLYDSPLSQNAKHRLELVRDTEDGFKIAEADWKLRGEGDILGHKQSGFPDYRFVDPIAHSDLIAQAAKEAAYIVEYSEKLPKARRDAIDILTQLFDWRVDMPDKKD